VQQTQHFNPGEMEVIVLAKESARFHKEGSRKNSAEAVGSARSAQTAAEAVMVNPMVLRKDGGCSGKVSTISGHSEPPMRGIAAEMDRLPQAGWRNAATCE
jgi:hypothetical protein